MNFVKWFRSEPHRDKYEADHPAFLAAREAWDASKKEREWEGLTDEQIDYMWRNATMKPGLTLPMVRSFARAIEAAHGIKGEA